MSRPPAKTPEQRQADLDAVLKQLSAGVEAIRSGDGWRGWLEATSRLHDYSARNVLLIWMQKPDAQIVAGFNAWKEFDRHVSKGERAIRVLAPVKRNVEVLDSAGSPIVDEAGKPRKENRIVGFRTVPVFDISQTEGAPFPHPPAPTLLTGQAPLGLWDGLAAQIQDAGFHLVRVESAASIGGANGRTDYGTRVVSVRADVSDAQAVKTLAHELAHVRLHEPNTAELLPNGPCRGTKEVEAESVAYLVAAANGMDTSDYSFAYVASWSARASVDVMLTTATRVRDTAASILHTLGATAADDDGVSAQGPGIAAPTPAPAAFATAPVLAMST